MIIEASAKPVRLGLTDVGGVNGVPLDIVGDLEEVLPGEEIRDQNWRWTSMESEKIFQLKIYSSFVHLYYKTTIVLISFLDVVEA